MKRNNEYQGKEEIRGGRKYIKRISKKCYEYQGKEEILGGRKYIK